MRIAFVAPWFRTLAHLYGERLQSAGHDVLVVTTDRHFQDGYALCPEAVIHVHGTSAATSTRGIAALRRDVRRFSPDLVVEDSFTDPRWLFTGTPRARWMMIHDPAPHDSRHQRRGIGQRTLDAQLRAATGVVAFSETSRRLLAGRLGPPVVATPLLSEMWDPLRTETPGPRRGFVCMGRISHYKGFDIGIEAWKGLSREQRDRHPLRVFASSGDIEILRSIEREPGIELHSGRFDFEDVSSTLSDSLAMLVPYRAGSQSGVQLLALQHGMVPVISALPGLVEYQPPLQPAVAGDADLAEWTLRLSQLAHEVTDCTHRQMREHYDRLTAGARVLDSWAPVLASAN